MSLNTKEFKPARVEPKMLGGSKGIDPSLMCLHSRMIEEVVTQSGKLTGRVRCLECRTEFDDPYHRGDCEVIREGKT